VPNSFRGDVWNRIAAEEQRSHFTWFHLLVDGIVRPWSAVCGVTAAVAIGLLLGGLSASRATDAKMMYAESISPFLQSPQK
jgi:hypothetical protein